MPTNTQYHMIQPNTYKQHTKQRMYDKKQMYSDVGVAMQQLDHQSQPKRIAILYKCNWRQLCSVCMRISVCLYLCWQKQHLLKKLKWVENERKSITKPSATQSKQLSSKNIYYTVHICTRVCFMEGQRVVDALNTRRQR